MIIAESALETIPREIWSNPPIVRDAAKRGKRPGQILLDRSYHHKAMLRLGEAQKRGRPDLVHLSLLQALGSPLNKEGLLETFVHTIRNYVIEVDPTVRLPKNYDRFVGLIEQLFEFGRVPPEGPPLMRLRKQGLSGLVRVLRPDRVVAFTMEGEPRELGEVVFATKRYGKLAVIVGGFPRGHFSRKTRQLADELVRIDKEGLEAYVVIPRVLYEYERLLGLHEARLES